MKLIEFINNKSKIDTSNWKLFSIKDLFYVSRGKRIVKNRDYVDNRGKDNIYSVVTAKTLNNAIDGYYSRYNCEGNVITSCGEVSGMISFYQEDKCWVLDTVRILKPKFNFLNKYIALFLIPLLNKWNYLFSYSRKAKPSDIENLTIKLPVDSNGNPDFEYMENYIKGLDKSININLLRALNKIENDKTKIDTSNWKEFKVKSLFNKKIIKKQSKTPSIKGETPFITAQSINNGIKTYVSKENVKTYPKNCITISTNGNCFDCFYHDYEIVASTDVEVLYSDSLNKYNALFLCSILNKQSEKYNYDKKPKNGIVWETIIKLPADKNGNPDWKYMENYIKSLSYTKYI